MNINKPHHFLLFSSPTRHSPTMYNNNNNRGTLGSNSGLTRYGSAPGSLLASIAESVISDGGTAAGVHGGFLSVTGSGSETKAVPLTGFFAGAGSGSSSPSSLISESSCLQRSSHVVGGGGVNGQLMRHSSSPAGFFSHLLVDDGYSMTRGMNHYSQPATGVHTMPHAKLKSQLSFSRQEPLSQISEIMGESAAGGSSSDEAAGFFGQSYLSSNYSLDETNSITFSASSGKRAKDSTEELLSSLSHIDSQYSLPTSLEMATVEKLLQAQQDHVAFKVRARRGCATHPRSIAERERRTKISKKLKNLEELVPNMDKQTSTSDMLDLAVQHIKELQKVIKVLNQERANCKCACKDEIP